jgi:Cd2+/Zn2+-exporting ATPase
MTEPSHSHHHSTSSDPCGHGCSHGDGPNELGGSKDRANAADAFLKQGALSDSIHATLGRRFSVTGLDCVEEVHVLKDALGPLVGGTEHLSFNVVRGELLLLPTANTISDQQIISRIAETGMKAVAIQASSKSRAEIESRWKIWAVTIAGLLFLAAMVAEILLSGRYDVLWAADVDAHVLTRFLLSLAIASSASTVVVKVWYSVRNLRLDMNSLMFIAILGAIALNQWMEAATVAFLFALSLQLETWSVFRARRAIDQLLKDDVATVHIVQADGIEREVNAESVEIGTQFIVRPGERLSLDGEIVSGRGEINEALVTGESFPVFKNLGDTVYAGTINGPATLTIESTRRADDTQLSRIIRLVSEHQAQKGTYETWVEQFSRWYTPSVLVIAVATVFLRWLVIGEAWPLAVYNGLALLVIACPCALVISTPVSVVAALSTAARSGILVKGGRALEMMGKVKTIAFDKTGTLTYGSPEVVDITAFGQHTPSEVLTRFAAVTSRSEHPLAKAIVNYAKEEKTSIPVLENFEAVPGEGAYGQWNGKTYRIGSPEYHLNFHVISPNEETTLESWRKSGYSIVVLSSDEHLCGAIALRDQVRPDAAKVIQQLRSRGVDSIVLLSGDHPQAAAGIARELGITDYRGGMLPQGKVDYITGIRRSGNLTAMVGDGINDAPALAAADLGIAMGAGTDVALETADIALIHNDLKSLTWLMDHSRRMLSIIRQNIAVAIGIKIFFALLALLGTATLWGAITADLGASLLVIFNGLRLLRK